MATRTLMKYWPALGDAWASRKGSRARTARAEHGRKLLGLLNSQKSLLAGAALEWAFSNMTRNRTMRGRGSHLTLAVGLAGLMVGAYLDHREKKAERSRSLSRSRFWR
jgi:hypothetical protein